MTFISFQSAVDNAYFVQEQPITLAQLQQLENKLHTLAQKSEQLIVLPNGTPQQLQMVLHFLTLHYPQKLAIAQGGIWKNPTVSHESFYHLLHHLIESNRFIAAELIVKNKDRDLAHLLQFAKRLKYGEAAFTNTQNPAFYFDRLHDVLQRDVQASAAECQFVQAMQGLIYQEQLPFLYFLQSYSACLYQNSDLTDFLVMLYRLAEELLLYAMGWDGNNKSVYTLRPRRKHTIPLPQKGQVITRQFNSLLNYVQTCDSFYATTLYEDFSSPWLLTLIQLRYDGLGGHGFTPYNHKQLEAICGQSPLEKLAPLLAKYNATSPHCFFTLLKEAMAARVRMLSEQL